MSLPTQVITVPVVGKWERGDGSAFTGKAICTPGASLLNIPSAGLSIVPPTLQQLLNSSGSISIPLWATDNPQTSPNGWQWTVVIQLDGGPTLTYVLPVPVGASSIDLTSLVPTDAVVATPGTTSVVSQAGLGAAIDAYLGNKPGSIGGGGGTTTVDLSGVAPKPSQTGVTSWDPTANGGNGGWTYVDLSPYAKTVGVAPRPASTGVPVWNATGGTWSSPIDPATLALKSDIADPPPVSLGTIAGTVQLNATTGRAQAAGLVGNAVVTGVTGTFGTMTLTLTQDAVGGHVVSFAASAFKWNGGQAQTVSLAPNTSTTLGIVTNSDGTFTLSVLQYAAASVSLVQQAYSLFGSGVLYAFEFDTAAGSTVLTDYGPNGFTGLVTGSPTFRTGQVAQTDSADQSMTFVGGTDHAELDGHQLVRLDQPWSLITRALIPSAGTNNGDTLYHAASATTQTPSFQISRSTGSPFQQVRTVLRTDQNATVFDVNSTNSGIGKAFAGVGHALYWSFDVQTAVTATVAGAATLRLYIDGQLDTTAAVAVPAGSTLTAPLQTFGTFRRYNGTTSGVTASSPSVAGGKFSTAIGVLGHAVTADEVARLQTVGA